MLGIGMANTQASSLGPSLAAAQPPILLSIGEELCDIRISATHPCLFFAIPLPEPALVSVEFQEFNSAGRCGLLLSPTETHPTTENAVWRLLSPNPKKKLVVHPADDNFKTGHLFLCIRYLEENGSTSIRLKVTLSNRFTGLWFRRARCSPPSEAAVATTIMRRGIGNTEAALSGASTSSMYVHKSSVHNGANVIKVCSDGNLSVLFSGTSGTQPSVPLPATHSPIARAAANCDGDVVGDVVGEAEVPPLYYECDGMVIGDDDNDCDKDEKMIDQAMEDMLSTSMRRGAASMVASSSVRPLRACKLTCSSLYIGEWLGSHPHGRGVAYYSVAAEAEFRLMEQRLTLLRTVYERRSLPWSAHSLPEDHDVPIDAQLVAALTGVADLSSPPSGWNIIQPIDPEIEVYDGEWEKGVKCGRGVYQWRDRAYVGEWSNGLREGNGVQEKKDGTWYRGKWCHDRRHGYGEALLLPAGTVYKGKWVNGFREGEGCMKYPSGVIIKGNWKRNRLYGDVTATYPDGTVYVGGWTNDCRNGSGVYTDAKGCVHRNIWVDDKRNGEGTIALTNGVFFNGSWTDDVPTRGSYHYPNGDVYVGSWDDARDCREGHGQCTFANGDMYTGGWHADVREGEGILISADGTSSYVGGWHTDRRHGHGVLTDSDGVYEGEFEEGARSGEGIQKGPDGSHYKGTWRYNFRSGPGVMYSAAEDVTYEGVFLHDRLQGEGMCAHVGKGERYEGTWLDGQQQGHGTHTFSNGDVMRGVWHRGEHQSGHVEFISVGGGRYVGGWRDGARYGAGTHLDEDGTVFEGSWRNNRRWGKGRLTKPDGETFEGEWRDDVVLDGPGKIIFIDGSTYEGELNRGIPHGLGVLAYPDGTTFSGTFRDGLYVL